MNILPVLSNLNINFQTEGHKHCRPGWVNMSCPHCTGNFGLHLGIRLDGERVYCWRCGGKNLVSTLAKITSLPHAQIKSILQKYRGHAAPASVGKMKIRRKGFKFPSNLTPLKSHHKKYLLSRHFNPYVLEKLWSLQATGPLAKLDGISYKSRILAPISWEGSTVSFQARDITGKHDVKYLACPKPREEILHQHIVYSHPDINWKLPVIVVEGITDVWRFGVQSVATFGIDFLVSQIRAITKNKRAAGNKDIVVAFDDDPQAIVKAEQLVAELCFRGFNAKRVHIIGDPGAMSQYEANQLVNEILNWRV